jgi:hypothetical protein
MRIAVPRAPGAERVVAPLELVVGLVYVFASTGPVALTILPVATAPLTLIVGILAATAVLIGVGIVDTVSESPPTAGRAGQQ